MLIGVDCQHLVEEGRTGTHNYLYNLLANLAGVDLQNKYVLYFKQEPSEMFWRAVSLDNPNWTYKVLKSGISWTQLSLASATFVDKPDYLICTWHTLPIIHNISTRIVSVIHDFSYKGYKEVFLYASLVMSYRLVGVSDFTYSTIIKLVPWRKRSVARIYEGVDTTKFKKSEVGSVDAVRYKYGLHDRYFISVGTLNVRKNLEKMIEAFCVYCNQSPELLCDYVIVGKCEPGYEHIYEFAKRNSFGNRIKFLGRLSDDDVVSLYSGALALLYVSLEEGFGLPILEAFSCSCPVITSNTSSTKEIGGDAAYLADPGNVEDIKNALLEVSTGGVQVQDRIAKGVNRVKLFSWQSCAENFLKIL